MLSRRETVKALIGVTQAPREQGSTTLALSPEERMRFHLEEFQRAAQEVYPEIKGWRAHFGPGSVAIGVAAFRA